MAATIHVQRRPGGWTDRARSYGVHVDDRERGKVKHGESVDVQVEPGTHAVKMKVDWCRSRELTVSLADGETASFEAAPRFPLIAIFAALFWFWSYIELNQI